MEEEECAVVETVKKPRVVKSMADMQRLKLEKLMKNPDKPVMIPERPKARCVPSVPDFVRNVMGSSAGAGSGEFHVYRHLRRKEYARQKYIHEKGERERLDDEYHQKLEDNKKAADEKTAKKRAKRQKKKQKLKNSGKKAKSTAEKSESSEEASESEKEEDEPANGTEKKNTENKETDPNEQDSEVKSSVSNKEEESIDQPENN